MLDTIRSKISNVKLANFHLSEKVNKVKMPKAVSFIIALVMNYFIGPLMTSFSMLTLVAPFVLLFLALFGQAIPINFQNTEEVMKSIFTAITSGNMREEMSKIIGDMDKNSIAEQLKMFSLNNIYLALTATGGVLFFLFIQNIYRYTNMINNFENKKYIQAFREFSVSFAPLLTVTCFYFAFVYVLTAMKGIMITLIMFLAAPVGLLGGEIDTVLRVSVVISATVYLLFMFLLYKKAVFPLLYNLIETIMYVGFYLTKWLRIPITVIYRIVITVCPTLVSYIYFKDAWGAVLMMNIVAGLVLTAIYYGDNDFDSDIDDSYMYKALSWIHNKMGTYNSEKVFVPKLPEKESILKIEKNQK